MMKSIFLIIWICYALFEGYRDGYFYHYRNTSRNPKDENIHYIYSIERFFILFILFICFDKNSLFEVIPFMAGLVLIFSLLHNSLYYETRHKLDPLVYPEGWRSSSTCSQATLEFSLIPRICLFVIGAGFIVVSYYI